MLPLYSQGTGPSLLKNEEVKRTTFGYELPTEYGSNISLWLMYGDTLRSELIDSWLEVEKVTADKRRIKEENIILQRINDVITIQNDSLKVTSDKNFMKASKNKNISEVATKNLDSCKLDKEVFRRKRNGWRVATILTVSAAATLTYLHYKNNH